MNLISFRSLVQEDDISPPSSSHISERPYPCAILQKEMVVTVPENTSLEYGYELLHWLMAKGRHQEALGYPHHLMQRLGKKYGRHSMAMPKYLLLFAKVEAGLQFWDAAEAYMTRAMDIFGTEQPTDPESRAILIECTLFYENEILPHDKRQRRKEKQEEERILNRGLICKERRKLMPTAKIIENQEMWWWRSERDAIQLNQVLEVRNDMLPEMAPPKSTLVTIVTHFHPDLICQVIDLLEDHELQINQADMHVKRNPTKPTEMWYVCHFYVCLKYSKDKLSNERILEITLELQDMLGADPNKTSSDERPDTAPEVEILNAMFTTYAMFTGEVKPFLGRADEANTGAALDNQNDKNNKKHAPCRTFCMYGVQHPRNVQD